MSFAKKIFPAQNFIQTLPWNGYESAVSLTYDDGGASQMALGLPELDKRNLKGTFFVNPGSFSPESSLYWKAAAERGHELANHTMSHPSLPSLGAAEAQAQILDTHDYLASLTGSAPISFAYPFCARAQEELLTSLYSAARGGGNEPNYNTWSPQPDWSNIISPATLSTLHLDTYSTWIRETQKAGAWLVLMIHGIECTPPSGEWEPVGLADYQGLLDELQGRRNSIWIERFGVIAAYQRCAGLLDTALAETAGKAGASWNVPAWCPRGLKLKIILTTPGKAKPAQEGVFLEPDSMGVYSLDFSKGSLSF